MNYSFSLNISLIASLCFQKPWCIKYCLYGGKGTTYLPHPVKMWLYQARTEGKTMRTIFLHEVQIRRGELLFFPQYLTYCFTKPYFVGTFKNRLMWFNVEIDHIYKYEPWFHYSLPAIDSHDKSKYCHWILSWFLIIFCKNCL